MSTTLIVITIIIVIIIVVFCIKNEREESRKKNIDKAIKNVIDNISISCTTSCDDDTKELPTEDIDEDQLFKDAVEYVFSSYNDFCESDYLKNLASLANQFKVAYTKLLALTNTNVDEYEKKVLKIIKEWDDNGYPKIDNSFKSLLINRVEPKIADDTIIFPHYKDIVNRYRDYWEDVISELMMTHAKIRRREYIDEQINIIKETIPFQELRMAIAEYQEYNKRQIIELKQNDNKKK